MRKWKQKIATALIVALTVLQALPTMADEAEPKGKWKLKPEGWVYMVDGDRVSNRVVTTGNGKGGTGTYYLKADGIMASEEWFVYPEQNEKRWYALPGGEVAMKKWVYLDKQDKLLSGNTGGDWYFFNGEGKSVRNKRKEQGENYYFFHEDGKMVSERWVGFKDGEEDGETISKDAPSSVDGALKYRYYQHDGFEARNKKLYLDGKWYQFNGDGIATVAENPEPEVVKSVTYSEPEDDEDISYKNGVLSVDAGYPVNVEFKVSFATPSQAIPSQAIQSRATPSQATPSQVSSRAEDDQHLTENHDFWCKINVVGTQQQFSYSIDAGKVYSDNILSFEYTPKYPGKVRLSAVVDGEESDEITITSEWPKDDDEAIRAKQNAMDDVFQSVKKNNDPDAEATAFNVSDAVDKVMDLCKEIGKDDDSELLQEIVADNQIEIQTMEVDYLMANRIEQTNEVSEEAADLLSSEEKPQLIGAVMNVGAETSRSGMKTVEFSVEPGNDVKLDETYENQVSLDLSLSINGRNKSSLTMPVMITIPIPKGIDPDDCVLYHQHGNEEPEEIYCESNGDDTVTFMTDRFSNFIFASGEVEEQEDNNNNNSSSGGSSRGGSSSGRKSHDSTKGWVSQTKGIITGEGSSYSKWQPEQAADGSMKWKLTYADGTMASGTIQTRADGTTYEQPAWENVNGAWYPFGADGFVKDGWVQDEQLGGIFYIDINQGMMTGWQLVDNKWYYFNPVSDGTMGILRVNTWIDGWYVGADGSWDQQPQVVNQ